MGNGIMYGDGIRIIPRNEDGRNEYYISNNTITKKHNWVKSPGVCLGTRIHVTRDDILEIRDNDISEHRIGFSLHGNPYDWTGITLFEGNKLHNNTDIGLEIGSDAYKPVSIDLGERPLPALDFGGGVVGSQGRNSFYDNGNYDLYYRYGSDLYIRNNYWGTNQRSQIRLKQDDKNATIVLGPLRDSWGNIIMENMTPRMRPW